MVWLDVGWVVVGFDVINEQFRGSSEDSGADTGGHPEGVPVLLDPDHLAAREEQQPPPTAPLVRIIPEVVPLEASLQGDELHRGGSSHPPAHPRAAEEVQPEVDLPVAGYPSPKVGHIFVSLFLLFDNASVIMMMVGNPSYRLVRRISYSIFLFGIMWQIMAFTIRLRESFRLESDLKKVLEEMTPVEFLEQINAIDEERKVIAIEFINLVGDFVPALARTNLPEIIIRTKVNKGTVGFFGIIASLTGILLKLKHHDKQLLLARDLHK